MIHARDEPAARGIAQHLSRQVEVNDYRPLLGTRGHEKTQRRYFLDEEQAWYREHVEAS